REPYIISTQSMDKETLAVGNLRQTSTVFYTEDYAEDVDTEVADILQAVIEDESFLKSSSKEINPYHFKTPLDLVFTRAKPEKTFVEMLCRKPNAKEISAWIKSRDQNFYSIEYTLYSVAGKRSKQRTFNPDFFIKLIKDDWEFILVVEIKADNDVSPENKAKLRYAKEHFRNLNAELIKGKIKQNYRFLFLSPNSYDAFFSYLREGKLFNKDIEFTSDLESLLHAENGS
ncbi:MAG: restriction endonuclease subunit R, partial [Bacteroidota bacterium]